MANELISVIITTHKRRPEILKRAIDSVYRQTYQNFEIFVVDDAPDFEEHESIVQLLSGYDNRLTYLINNRKPGANASRNKGILASNGVYIALLDDDDEWCEDKIEIFLPMFTDGVGLVYGNFNVINIKHNLYIPHKMTKYEGNVFNELLLYGNFIGGCSIPIILKEAIINVGLFDEEYRSAQDYDLWLRLAKRYRVVFVDKAVVNYYISSDAISTSPLKRIESRERMLQKYSLDYARLPAAKKRVIKDIIYANLMNGNVEEAKKYYNKNREYMTFPVFLSLYIKGVLKCILLKVGIQNR